jgi:hypothetical protein
MSFQQLRDTTGATVANVSTANQLLGTTLQTASVPSMLRIAASVPSASANVARMNLFAGGRQLTGRNGQLVPIESAAGRGPDAQLGWLGEWPVAAGELLELMFISSAIVAAPGVTWIAQLDPL